MSDWVLFEFGREGKIIMRSRRADLGTLLILNASLRGAASPTTFATAPALRVSQSAGSAPHLRPRLRRPPPLPPGGPGLPEDPIKCATPSGAAAMTVPCPSARWSPASRWRSKPACASGSRAAADTFLDAEVNADQGIPRRPLRLL